VEGDDTVTINESEEGSEASNSSQTGGVSLKVKKLQKELDKLKEEEEEKSNRSRRNSSSARKSNASRKSSLNRKSNQGRKPKAGGQPNRKSKGIKKN